MASNADSDREGAAGRRGGLPPTLPASPCDCATDPIGGLRRLFVDYFQGLGMAAGRDPATRPVFLRLHGVAHGTLRINDDLPAELRVGLFGKARDYPVWVRFSSDRQPGIPDLNGTIGIAIKVFDVEGRKLLGPDEEASTHDFILQNSDVFFVDTARDMCEFTCQSLNGHGNEYLQLHPTTDRILKEMEKTVESVLATAFWSGLPSRYGEGRFVKYKLEPVDVPAATERPDFDDPGYLRSDLQSRMRQGDSVFRFMVQFQTNETDMPLDKATVRWSEESSPPFHVATLTLPRQDLATRGQNIYGENLAFNPWHALPEHAPQGSLAEARKIVYQASADRRRNVNGIPTGEPGQPRPDQYEPGVDYPAARDRRIVRVAIHPAIGVARVGNSKDEYFIGPQVISPTPKAAGFYRDAQGALKRQAAEFRVYAYNAAGEVVREITADWGVIHWSAHLANRKAAWYQWQIAMDIPEAATVTVDRRNQTLTDPAIRAALVIDSGKRSISGRGSAVVGLDGQFIGVAVSLGELRTDPQGRLLVLAGRGVSASPSASPIYVPDAVNAFANSDGWYDDIADGPVTATVDIDGQRFVAEPAWVVTAPPNYAPQLKGERSLYDLLYDLYVKAGWLPALGQLSFKSDVYPLLQRLTGLQWVNQGYAAHFGHGGPFNFEDPALITRLSQKVAMGAFDPHAELRRQVFNSFRPPNPVDGNQMAWPWLYGDAMEVPATNGPRQNATVTDTQYGILRRWVKGDFVDDWTSAPPPAATLKAVPLAEQPVMLDRAALEYCLADGFHPGCEMTWPMRHLTIYARPFRIKHRPEGLASPSFGAKLTQQKVLAVNGPLYDQGPGELTRWMAVPWQADTAFCRSGYDTSYDPFAPSFWPARVPNQVLSTADYAVAVDPTQPAARRQEAFSERTNWNEQLGSGIGPAMEKMVKLFGSMGLVEQLEGVVGDPTYPAVMMVASYGPDVAAAEVKVPAEVPEAALLAKTAAAPGRIERRLPRGANFQSPEAGLQAPLPVRIPKA